MQLEHRRGVEQGIWRRLWHFNKACGNYPSRSFAIRKDKPSKNALCARCCSATD
jgi:hypothetical protein